MMGNEREIGLPSARLLSTDQAAAYCGMSPNHFKKHANVSPINFGNRILYDRKSLDEWIDQFKDSTPAPELRGLGSDRANSAH
ncbi:hypothetical protein MXMO3_01751 [Maritalea myrionectae]|uniref:Helix-turn-helix domain-containing protein n=1 Tax=Maritalea myrionectae TaxID=454601 RepID=A0A2R4MEG3_9HYPH|nr:hypothetical protein MXMO3_01751 [Maritalea myrionectae]